MIFALLLGILAGTIIAMPPGIAGVGAMRYGLFTGIKQGNWFAFANGIMDFFYCFLAIFTTSFIASDLIELSRQYPIYFIIFQVLIILMLITLGWKSIKDSQKLSIDHTLKNKKMDFITKFEHKGPFLFGLAIGLTNIANPSFFGTLLSLTSFIHTEVIIQNTFWANFVFAVGFGIGNFFWLMFLMRIINKYRDRLSENMMSRIQQLAGISFIGFGTVLGARLLFFTKWGELLKYLIAF